MSKEKVTMSATDRAEDFALQRIDAHAELAFLVDQLMRQALNSAFFAPGMAVPRAAWKTALDQTERALAMQYAVARVIATTTADVMRQADEAVSADQIQNAAEMIRRILPYR